MKRLFKFIIFPLMLVFTLASCGNNNSKIKTVLNSLDSKSFDRNGFTMTFNHKYNIESHIDDEFEKTDYTLHYDGNGTIITSIDGLANDINQYSLYDLITTKVGYIKVIQKEKSDYDFKEVDKAYNTKQEDKYNYEIEQELVLKFDENYLYISSISKYVDSLDNSKNSNKEFNGKISKEEFTDNITSDSIDMLYDQIIVMDGVQTNIAVQNHTSDLFVKSKNLSDSDFDSFVKNNQISIEEDGNNSTISFSYPCDQFLASLFNLKESNAKISGKLIVDNNTKNLTHFEYDFKDFMFNALDGIDTENLTTTNIDQFKLTGDSFTTPISDIKLEKEFTEYTDLVEFMDALYDTMPSYFE